MEIQAPGAYPAKWIFNKDHKAAVLPEAIY